MTNIKQHKQAAGFTLIEVLISITIFAIGVLAVITMQVNSLCRLGLMFLETEH